MILRTVPNRTNKYVYPAVNLFGKTFLKELNGLTDYATSYRAGHSILFTGIGDVLYYRAKDFKIESLLFMVIDIRGCYNEKKDIFIDPVKGKERFKSFLKYVRTSKYYKNDYWFKSNQHCIVFDLSSVAPGYMNFIQSNYSRIWTKEDLDKMYIKPKMNVGGKEYLNAVHAVLTKSDTIGLDYLKSKIYETYNTEHIPDNPKEYDIPWIIQDEFLNSKYMTEDEREIIVKFKTGASIRAGIS